jgi:hypothetical protein
MKSAYLDSTGGQNAPNLYNLKSKFDGKPWTTDPNSYQKYYAKLCIIKSLYDGPIANGQNWPMTLTYWGDVRCFTAKPRLKGKYLPIEIFWDPILKVRDWRPWGGTASYLYRWEDMDGVGMVGEYVGTCTEIGRDMLTRRRGALGYDLFLFSTGCIKNLHDAKIPWPCGGGSIGGNKHSANYEQPARYATKSRDMTTSALPSAWVASCIRPVRSYKSVDRTCPSHFGLREGVMGDFRFNVAHVDGHVDHSVWMEDRDLRLDVSDWLFGTYAWSAPYGWRFKTTSSPEYSETADTNLEPIPGFPLAFDRNK